MPARKNGFGCGWGFLVLIAIGVASVALLTALRVQQDNAALKAHVRSSLNHMAASSVMADVRDADGIPTNCSKTDDIIDLARCMCDQFGCTPSTGTCTNAPTGKIKTSCIMCMQTGLPCSHKSGG